MNRSIKLSSAVFTLLFSASIFGRGGEVNNGGGSAEHNFAVAYQNLEKFISYCLGSERCSSGEATEAALKKISAAMQQERATVDQLQFLSGSSITPNPFDFDGAVRVAKTGDSIGSKIWMNLDLIYPVDHLGAKRAMTVGEAVAVLVHEFGHHHSIDNHQFLDSVGAKVRDLVENTINQSWLYNGKISMTTINFFEPLDGTLFPTPPSFMVYGMPALIVGGHEVRAGTDILYDSEYYQDLSSELSRKLSFPHHALALEGFKLTDFRWKRGRFAASSDIQVLARVCVMKHCEGDADSTSAADKTQTYELEFRFHYPERPENDYMGMKYTDDSLVVKKVNDWLPCPHDS